MTQNSKILSFDTARKGASRRSASSDRYAGLDYYGERYGKSQQMRDVTSLRLAGGSRDSAREVGLLRDGKEKRFAAPSVNVQRGGKDSFAVPALFSGMASSDTQKGREDFQDEEFHRSAKEQRARNREQIKRSRAKAKAEKAFSKQYGGTQAGATPDAGPRAAVYQGQMGSSHKRAARLQAPDTDALKNFGFSPSALLGAAVGMFTKWLGKPRSAVVASVAICLVLTAGFLYPSARTYYQAVREEARLELEYAALEERNKALSESVTYLQTDAGIEARARSQYGWVKDGEQAGSVSGVDAVQEDAKIAAKVMSDEIKPPTTWYSVILDPLFGVES